MSVEFPMQIPQSNISLSDNVKRTHDPVPANTDTHTVSSSPKVPSPKPIVSKTVVKPTVGIAKSSATTTSSKTTLVQVELLSLQLNLICNFLSVREVNSIN